jgi:curved DNA-binding protein CbpA
LERIPAEVLMVRDPYQVLGVGSDAAAAEITAAYRALVRRLHPDHLHCADLERLREVIAAYQALRAARRSGHDRHANSAAPVRVRVHRPPSEDEPELRAGPVRWHPPGA